MKEIQKKRNNSILLFMPILILPFLAIGFYALGGGRQASKPQDSRGINTNLPDATFKIKDPQDKLGFYALSEQDSVFKTRRSAFTGKEDMAVSGAKQAAEIEKKLANLSVELGKPPVESPAQKNNGIVIPGMKSDVDRLEKMMRMMQQSPENDPEMKAISNMLEKVLDIQHPQRLSEDYQKNNGTGSDSVFLAIAAVVDKKQKVIQGTVLDLILKDSVLIRDFWLRKGQRLSGLVNITNQRLMLDIKTIRVGKKIIPVDLSVYSLDGIKGISAPNAIISSSVAGGADDAIRSIQLLGMESSTGAQIAGAGIDAAKGLFSKKVKRIRVTLNAGLEVLLKNNMLKN